MAKTDVKSTFQIIPIHTNGFALLCIKKKNLYYPDGCLPRLVYDQTFFLDKWEIELPLATKYQNLSLLLKDIRNVKFYGNRFARHNQGHRVDVENGSGGLEDKFKSANTSAADDHEEGTLSASY